MRSLAAATTLALSSLAVAPVAAQTGEQAESIYEPIHSNLPLHTFEWKDLWPRNSHSGETFGCSSRVGFGDWRFSAAATDEDKQGYWVRLDNYGVIHCAAIIRTTEKREDLGKAEWAYGFFVRLGTARVGADHWELWAIQKGMRPGSEYTLLARAAGQAGLVTEFRVLQQRCPRGRLLEVEGLDVWSTRYCAINSRRELLALARQMMRLPPLGIIERVAEPPVPGPPSEPADSDDN
jgi:hypothetical protein